MAKQRTYATKRSNGRNASAGSLRVRDIEKKVRKPAVKPSRTYGGRPWTLPDRIRSASTTTWSDNAVDLPVSIIFQIKLS